MAKLERSELLKLAEMTSLKLTDAEVDSLRADLNSLLSYTDQLNTVDLGAKQQTHRNTNVFRDDVATPEVHDLLSNAPEKEESYFVVPQIVDDSKEPA